MGSLPLPPGLQCPSLHLGAALLSVHLAHPNHSCPPACHPVSQADLGTDANHTGATAGSLCAVRAACVFVSRVLPRRGCTQGHVLSWGRRPDAGLTRLAQVTGSCGLLWHHYPEALCSHGVQGQRPQRSLCAIALTCRGHLAGDMFLRLVGSRDRSRPQPRVSLRDLLPLARRSVRLMSFSGMVTRLVYLPVRPDVFM